MRTERRNGKYAPPLCAVEARLIRSANHSSFPKIGESALDQQIRTTLRHRELGTATDADVSAAVDEVVSLVVAEQSRAFLDLVTDGQVRWDGPTAHLRSGLAGLEPGPVVRWFDTNFHERRNEVTGPIRRRAPFLVRDFELAAGVARAERVKVVLPGPVTAARSSRDRHYGSLALLADAIAAALAEEVAALVAAGARCFQLDEPLLCRHPEDLGLVRRTADRVFQAAGPGATTILATYFGDLAALGAGIAELPGTHLGVDLTGPAADLDWLVHLSPGKGVALGLLDARASRIEDAADLAARLAPWRDGLTSRDVIVGPNAGLELLPRDVGFEKLQHARYLVEQLSREWTWRS